MKMMEQLRGKPVADNNVTMLKPLIEGLCKAGHTPTLGVVRVGARDDDLAYERGLLKRFGDAGCAVKVTELAENCTQGELDKVFDEMNASSEINGILVFRPLPKHLSDAHMTETIDCGKDVDFMNVRNMADVLAGKKGSPAPCTAEAVIDLLHFYNVDIKGKKAVVLGRSLVIGKPVALLLTTENATVTVCHTKTADIKKECLEADIIVACCGVAGMVKGDWVRPGQVVADVGMNVDENGKLCGDCAYDELSEVVDKVTPVPGGVGSVTTSVLLRHTVLNCAAMNGIDTEL